MPRQEFNWNCSPLAGPHVVPNIMIPFGVTEECPPRVFQLSAGPLCHSLSRSDLHAARSNELKRNLTRPTPVQQVFDRAGQLLVKRNRGFRFDVKTWQVAVLDVPDLCLGIHAALTVMLRPIWLLLYSIHSKLGERLLPEYCH